MIALLPNTETFGFENLRTPPPSRLTSHTGTTVLNGNFLKVAGVSLLSLSPEGKVRPTGTRAVDSSQGQLVSICPPDALPEGWFLGPVQRGATE